MQAFAALSDPTRLRIVEMLVSGPRSAGDIARQFEMTAPAVSQHLKNLRAAGLVRVEAQAQRRIYQLDPKGIDELAEWITRIRRFWSRKLDALDREIRMEKKT